MFPSTVKEVTSNNVFVKQQDLYFSLKRGKSFRANCLFRQSTKRPRDRMQQVLRSCGPNLQSRDPSERTSLRAWHLHRRGKRRGTSRTPRPHRHHVSQIGTEILRAYRSGRVSLACQSGRGIPFCQIWKESSAFRTGRGCCACPDRHLPASRLMGRKCLATESPRLIVFVVAKLPGPQAGTLKHGQEWSMLAALACLSLSLLSVFPFYSFFLWN